MNQVPARKSLLRRKWLLALVGLFLGLGLLWGLTYSFGPRSAVNNFVERFEKNDVDREGKATPYNIRENCEFTGEGLQFRAVERPNSIPYLCIGKPRVVGPLLVEVDYEWCGSGWFNAGGFTATYLWTPWKSYLCGQTMHWIS